MRTTLELDDDLIEAAREIARREKLSLGKVVSRLAREALLGKNQSGTTTSGGSCGFRPFPSRGTPVTNEAIDNLRDEAGT